jgi:transposase, IS30 family
VPRRVRPRPGKIAADPVLRWFVADRLEKRWSPQQVSRALPGEFPGERAGHVVHETVYQAVYRPERGGWSRERPARVLRTRRRRRRPHGPCGRAAAERDHRDDHDRSAARRGGRAQ